jgi:hypothetical protein
MFLIEYDLFFTWLINKILTFFWEILAKTKVNMIEEEDIIIVVISKVNMVINDEN